MVITSSHAFARTFAGSGASTHLSYVHSPARYLWFPDVDHRSAAWRRPIEAPVRNVLKRIDRRSTDHTESLAANSATTRRRIREVYRREARIIHPPVDVKFFDPGDSVSSASRSCWRSAASFRTSGWTLRSELLMSSGSGSCSLVTGPNVPTLEALASSLAADVEFVRSPSDDELRTLYRRAAALMFFANEDFGIIPVEAQACGCPVVTAGEGGALETVVDGRTGVHADASGPGTPGRAVREVLDDQPSADECRTNALRFSYGAFGTRSGWVGDAVV